jgi:AraC-like DNA-binding protein
MAFQVGIIFGRIGGNKRHFIMIITDIDNLPTYESGGRFMSRGGWSHQRREIDSFELLVGIEGAAYLEQGDCRYELIPGSALFFLPNLCHGGYALSHGPVSFYWFHFRLPKTEEVSVRGLRQTMPKGKLCLPIFSRPAEGRKLPILCRQLLDIANSGNYPGVAKDYALALALMEINAWGTSAQRAPGRLDTIAEWVRSRAEGYLDARSVAEAFRLNPDYLTRLFKKEFGVGLKRYIQNAKLNRAKELLCASELTVKEIAFKLGYLDDKSFMKAFKASEGMGAGDFRRAFSRTHLNQT